MKHKKLDGIVVLLVCIIALVIGSNLSLRKDVQELKEAVTLSDNEVTDLNSQLTVNDELIDKEYDALNAKIKTYEDLIINWFDFDIYNIYQPQLIQKSYDATAVVHTSEGSFDLPKNGYIEVDSDFVEIEINIIEPPEVNNHEINQWIHYYDNVLATIDYEFIENYTLENNTLRIKYDDLENGDHKSILLSNLLSELLDLENEKIKIKITNEVKKASDYIPKLIKAKTFSSSYNSDTFTHTFEYLSDSEWIVDYRYGGIGDIISNGEYNDAYNVKFKIDDYIEATEGSWDGEVFSPLLTSQRLVLPEIIRLGESWQDDTREATITAVDYIVQTSLGEFETLEVSYSNVDGDTEIICYYAKDLGVIKRRYYINDDELLIHVEYIK